MRMYKQYADIDAEGKLVLKYLPFRNQKHVEVVLLIDESEVSDINIEEKIQRLKASFGTIKSSHQFSDEMLTREEIYDEEGR